MEGEMEEAVRSGALPQDGRLAAADESELVAACVKGEPDAYRELLARYRRSAVTLAFQMLGNAEDAEDVAQEAFVRVFQAIPHFRRQASFSTWLYRIVTNLCLGRKRRARPTVQLDAVHEPRAAHCTSRCVTEGILARQVLAAIPAEMRVILLLREQEELSYAEIADALDLPMGTVRSRLSKARMAFRELWNRLSETGAD
jgi:RNA polymerase sigma-70 factor (ECF subfamily)